MMVKKGQMTNLTSDFNCNDGTRITQNGEVTRKNGSQIMLKEGDYIDASGKMIPINNTKTSKDKDMYLVPDSTLKKNK